MFIPGQTDYIEELNRMLAAFNAGPYNALPSTGGAMTGPLTSTAAITVASPDQDARTALIPPRASAGNTAESVNPALHLGVAGDAIATFSGRFALATSFSAGAGGRKEAYKLHFRTFSNDGTGSETPDLLVVRGTGQVDVPGTLTVGTVGSNLIPSTDNARTLGSAALAYSVVHARTGAINTSDARLKHPLRDLTTAEITAARDIARAIGIYRWRDAVDVKGDAAREHVGPTVQRAIEIMQAHGLDPLNYGFICYDEWEQQTVEHPAIEACPAVLAAEAVPEVLDIDGNVITPAVPASPGLPAIEARAAYAEVTQEAGDRYAFRYDELAMFIAAGQEARLAALEAA